jgi:precorrin-6B methylase 2
LITPAQLTEHQGYLADERRIAAYRAALAEIVQTGDVVLDLGAGTGILGYLACEAGAKAVIAVDRSDILETARRIAADNGYLDRITHIKALSTEAMLETLVDVVVCDQIGGMVHDAGVLSAFADARKRLLAPGGRFVPSSFRIFAAPVSCPDVRARLEFWSSAPASIDVSAVRPLAANTEWMLNLTAAEMVRLADETELASFSSDHDAPISGTVEFEAKSAGAFDGFVGWFEAQLSPTVTLTNNPWSPDRFNRWCNFYPIDRAIDVANGERIRLTLDIRPQHRIVSWTIDLLDRPDTRQVRHSNFLTTSTTDLSSGTDPVPHNANIGLTRTILDLIDGTRTTKDIVESLSGEIGKSFVSRAHLESFVRKVTAVVR